MATLEVGPGFYTDFNYKLWQGRSFSLNALTMYTASMLPIMPIAYQTSGNWLYGTLQLYKGTVPTDFSGLTTYTSRISDSLLKYEASSFGGNNPSNVFTDALTDFSSSPVVINTTYIAATASGVATWFRIHSEASTFQGPYSQIVGTIGTVGSGADLEMANTNIVSGRYYRVKNLRIQIDLPTTFQV